MSITVQTSARSGFAVHADVHRGNRTRQIARVLLMFVLFLSISPQTYAADSMDPSRYRLVEGNGYTVCEAFLKNLNAFPKDEPPMVCEQKIHPSHPEFTRPLWEEMNVQNNLKLIYQAESLMVRFTPSTTTPKPYTPQPYEEWEKKYQQRIKSGEAIPRLRKAVWDLNGNGPETLIWYDDRINQCRDDMAKYKTQYGGGGGHIFVLRSKTGVLEPFGGLLGTEGRTDVVLYRNKSVYFTNAYPDAVLGKVKNRPVWAIGVHPISPRLTGKGKYLIRHRCVYHADR